MRHVAIAALAVAMLAPALPALACGPLPDVSVAIIGSSPRNGEQDVALDAPLIFDVRCDLAESWPTGLVRDVACSDFGDQLVLELHAEGEAAPVAGQAGTLRGKLVFLPSAKLRPNTAYRASARVRSSPSDVLSTPLELSFRTGGEPLPALVSADPPSITLEWYDAPRLRCDGGELVGDRARDYLTPKVCPTGPYSDCKEAGTRRALRYRISAGALSGGETRLPYVFEALVTDGTPGTFDTPWRVGSPSEGSDGADHTYWEYREAAVAAGERGEIFIDAPVGAEDAELLCVRMRVVDAAGHVLAPEGRCDGRAERVAAAGGDEAGAGCSVQARGASAGWGGAAWIGIAALGIAGLRGAAAAASTRLRLAPRRRRRCGQGRPSVDARARARNTSTRFR